MEIPRLEGAGHSRHGLNCTSHEGGRSLGHSVVDRDAGSFVEQLDAEDASRAHRAIFVGAGEGDVEGQDLIAVQGCRQFLVGACVGDGDVVQLVDGIADGRQKR